MPCLQYKCWDVVWVSQCMPRFACITTKIAQSPVSARSGYVDIKRLWSKYGGLSRCVHACSTPCGRCRCASGCNTIIVVCLPWNPNGYLAGLNGALSAGMSADGYSMPAPLTFDDNPMRTRDAASLRCAGWYPGQRPHHCGHWCHGPSVRTFTHNFPDHRCSQHRNRRAQVQHTAAGL